MSRNHADLLTMPSEGDQDSIGVSDNSSAPVEPRVFLQSPSEINPINLDLNVQIAYTRNELLERGLPLPVYPG
jgi:hypothetical protein